MGQLEKQTKSDGKLYKEKSHFEDIIEDLGKERRCLKVSQCNKIG